MLQMIDAENGSNIYRTTKRVAGHEGVIRLLELWSMLGHVPDHERPD